MILAATVLVSQGAIPVTNAASAVVLAKKPPKGTFQPLYSVGFVCDSCGLPLRTVLDSLDKFASRYRDSFAVLSKAHPGTGGDIAIGLEIATTSRVNGSFGNGGSPTTRTFVRELVSRELGILRFEPIDSGSVHAFYRFSK